MRRGMVRTGAVWRGRHGLARIRKARTGRERSGEAGNEINMNGPELKQLRKKLGLSLAQAARQVEVSPRTWARWEAGDQNIPEGAMKLFRILNGLEKP